MSKKYKKIVNGQIATPYRIINGGQLLFADGKIEELSEGNIDAPDAEIIDAEGHYVSPGFIDIHVHGGGNADFMDDSVDAFCRVANTHAKYGTTAMLPTVLTSTKEAIIRSLQVYEQAQKAVTQGARFLGVHIEGPYLSMEQRGAQDPRYIRDPDPEEYFDILNSSTAIRRWSVAPEKSGALTFGRILCERGILPSIAHTDAIYDDVIRAFEHGYSLATHFYSAMSGVSRRDAYRYGGVVESAFLIDEMDVEIIADGKHLPAELLRLIYKHKGPEHIALITDAMRAAAMPEGTSMLGSLEDGIAVIVEDGVAKLPDRTAFAGSTATADRLVRTMVTQADVPLVDAIRMISATPARIIGVNDVLGSLVQGKQADVVIFDKDIVVRKTIIQGDVVYDREYQSLPA
ncbi:N-acetylglucosamine-6-phosphate deacetylase [Parapedobacter deserti]|uniref:N-acetylglucosamine-6-phosphate deacetylase n=1 Tax=Parapedobacter deserti TaxID=1912957 RepID=A0ABV7JMC3_9SPHI